MKTIIYTFLFLSLVGCKEPNITSVKAPGQKMAHETASHKTLWPRLTSNFKINSPKAEDHKHLELYISRYSKQSFHISKLSYYASPYLFHIVEELENRGLPGELALLPMIESAYKPNAQSNQGASGLWQIGSTTGKRYGLQQNGWYDGRRDVAASTKAALDYLEFLNKEFNGDWLLALAAYNSGEGRVKRAIKKNKAMGKPTDYWSLSLPVETQHFVPRLLALAHIIKESESHGIKLLPIDNKPYFTTFNHHKQIDLHVAACLAEVDIQELKRLNPAYKKSVTHPEGPHQLLVPTDNIKMLEDNISNNKTALIKYNIIHVVQEGESLSLISQKYKTSVNDIKIQNKMKSDLIVLGTKLTIPNERQAAFS